MPISGNTPLYSLLQDRFGESNTKITFLTPDLRGRNNQSVVVFCLSQTGDYPDIRVTATLEPAQLLGQIKLFHPQRIPTDFMVSEGQLLAIEEHTDLFAILNTRFGGDGQRTFALPNLIGCDPLSKGSYAIAVKGPAPDMEELLMEW